MAYTNPAFPLFVATFGAFVLLVFASCSSPLISSFYFLYSSQAGGVRFGMWGWCLDEDHACLAPLQLGYTWEPQIAIPITKALVFYPIAAGFTLFAMISLIPVLCNRIAKTDIVFSVLSFASFFMSLLAFVFMIAMWGVAKTRFEKAGFKAHFGPLPWMSLSATIVLFIVAVYSGHGTLWSRPRKSRRTRSSKRTNRY